MLSWETIVPSKVSFVNQTSESADITEEEAAQILAEEELEKLK